MVPVVDPHLRDGLGDFLAVGADVLDRGGAGQAGDAGQALQAGQALGERTGDHGVPFFARRDGDQPGFAAPVEAAGRHLDHGAVETLVGYDQVAAAAEDQHRLAARVGGADRLDQVGSVPARTKLRAGPPRPIVV